MKPAQSSDPQALPLEEQLVGVNAKTALYPGARSWSGGRHRILGKGPLESYCYHVMSRTCGGEVLFDEVEKEGAAAGDLADGGVLRDQGRYVLPDE